MIEKILNFFSENQKIIMWAIPVVLVFVGLCIKFKGLLFQKKALDHQIKTSQNVVARNHQDDIDEIVKEGVKAFKKDGQITVFLHNEWLKNKKTSQFTNDEFESMWVEIYRIHKKRDPKDTFLNRLKNEGKEI